MTLAPGSAVRLLRHELRLAWRGTAGSRLGLVAIGAGSLWLAYHVAVWYWLRAWPGPTAMTAPIFALLGLAVWFLFTLMVSQAIMFSVDAFFERGDLDLLLASPVAVRHVFLVRGLGVAVASGALYAALLTPFAHVGALLGIGALLAVYPAVAALALLAAAIGMASTAVLVRLLGARRARTAAQLFGALVGAAFFLVLQWPQIVSPERSARWLWSLRDLAAGHEPGAIRLAWLPLHALLGDPRALTLLIALGAGAFWWVVTRMAARFLAGSQEAMAAETPAPEVAAGSVRFRPGLWRNVLVKEWKLIGRDPQLIGQTLLQSLYILPVGLIWLREDSRQIALAPVLVMLSAMLASGLAWVTVAAEDAPELLAAAPVERGWLRRAKLVAALAPVWAIMIPLALYLARSDAFAGATFAACMAGATIASGGLHLLLPRPGRRRDLRRRSRGNLLVMSLEFATSIAWPALTWCLLAAPKYAPFPAALALAVPVSAWWLGRAERHDAAAP